jgi:hypothetical protein
MVPKWRLADINKYFSGGKRRQSLQVMKMMIQKLLQVILVINLLL